MPAPFALGRPPTWEVPLARDLHEPGNGIQLQENVRGGHEIIARMRVRALLLLAMAEAVLACRTVPPEPTVPVVIATQDVLSFDVLTTAMLGVQNVPQRYVQPNTVSDPSLIVGRLPIVLVFNGEQIMTTKLAPLRDPVSAPPGFYKWLVIDTSGTLAGIAQDDIVRVWLRTSVQGQQRLSLLVPAAVVDKPLRTKTGASVIGLYVAPEDARRLSGADPSALILESIKEPALEQLDIDDAIGIPKRLRHDDNSPRIGDYPF